MIKEELSVGHSSISHHWQQTTHTGSCKHVHSLKFKGERREREREREREGERGREGGRGGESTKVRAVRHTHMIDVSVEHVS